MRSFSVRQVLRNYKEGKPWSVWSYPTQDPRFEAEGFSDGNGGERAFGGRIPIRFVPKFALPKDTTFFTAGSCFAREIELALHRAGRDVLSWNPACGIAESEFHRYNTFSIIADFEYAAGRVFDVGNASPVGDKFIDFTGFCVRQNVADLLSARDRLTERYRGGLTADVVIITLGLVEVWYDKVTDTYLNIAPLGMLHATDRFELRITDYEDNRMALDRAVRYLKLQNPNARVILSVSPVPFSETFSGEDVVVANMYSKSVLRAVAQDVAASLPYVDYFPSYEICLYSNPSLVWMSDHRHVLREHVGFIVDQFLTAYSLA